MNFASLKPWTERTLLCLAVFLAYASVWPNGFVLDDIDLIVQHVFLKQWDSAAAFLKTQSLAYGTWAGAFYRPVSMLLYFFIYRIFGLSAFAFHAVNVVLHAFNACLLHHFGVRAGFRKGAAFGAALIWVVHPVYSEEVAYISALPELLWSMFCLLGLIALLPDFRPRKIALAIILLLLALASKGSAIVFPALATITLFFISKNRTQASAYLKTWPLWLLTAGCLTGWAIFVHMTGFSIDKTGDPAYFQDYTTNVTNRILTSLATLPVYAGLIVWPAGLHMERSFSVVTTLLQWKPAVGALMAGLGLVQIFWGRARRGLALSFGLLWFAAALSPATGIAFPVNAMISEGWLYMPLMGLFLGVAQAAAVFFEKKSFSAPVLVLVLVILLGTVTFFQNKTLLNPETLYQNVIKNGGNPLRITADVGAFYLERREFDKAIELSQYQLSHPDGRRKALWAESHMLLAQALLQIELDEDGKVSSAEDIARGVRTSSRIPEAIRELGKALQADPDYYLAHQYLAIVYRVVGNTVMADFHDRKAQEILQKQGKYGP